MRDGPFLKAVERAGIGASQLEVLLVAAMVGQGGTVVNRLLTHTAGRDLWVSVLLALVPAAAATASILSLARRYPGRDLAAIVSHLLGPLAYPVILAYTALFTAAAAEAAAEFGAFSTLILVSTPSAAVVLPLVGSAVYASLLGLEVTARVNSALWWFLDIPLGLVLGLLFTGQERPAYLLPVLARGWGPVLSGAQVILGTWGLLVLLWVLLPAASSLHAGARAAWRSLGWTAALTAALNLGPVLVFGDLVDRLTWPTYMMIRVVQAGRFVERLDIVAVWLWVHATWVYVTLLLHAAAVTLARLWGLGDHRAVALVLGAVIWILAAAGASQVATSPLHWGLRADGFLGAGIAMPVVLRGIAWLRHRGQARAGA